MRESKTVKCVDCGNEFPRKELNRKFRCPDCAWKAVGEVSRQLHDKSGPYYERWKQGLQAAADKL